MGLYIRLFVSGGKYKLPAKSQGFKFLKNDIEDRPEFEVCINYSIQFKNNNRVLHKYELFYCILIV
jgi:hypothetical protein